MPDHSYVTIRSRLSASVQDILASVTEKLQYSEEQGAREDALVLVTVASSGGGHGACWGGSEGWGDAGLDGADPPQFAVWAEKAVLQPSEECVFTTLGINSHLFACTRDAFDSLVSTRGGPFLRTHGHGPPRLQPFSLLSAPSSPRRCRCPRRSRWSRGTRRSTAWSPRTSPTTSPPSTGSSSAASTRCAKKQTKKTQNPREKGF